MSADTGPRRIMMGISIFIVVLLAFVLVRNIQDESVYYLTVEEAKERGWNENEDVRVAGLIQSETISIDEENEQLSFQVADPDRENFLTVEYDGDKPDGLKEQEQVVVEGEYQQDKFRADLLMFQCPSQYQEELEE